MSDLTLREFTDGCNKTWSGHHKEDRAFLGLAGECGEVMEIRKKFLRGDFDIKEYRRRLSNEIPDALFYLVEITEETGVDLDASCRALLTKLASRMENGTIKGDGSDRT